MEPLSIETAEEIGGLRVRVHREDQRKERTMSNEKGANYSGGVHRLPPGYEWRYIGHRWHACRRISSMRASRITEQLLQRSKRGVFTSLAQERAAKIATMTGASRPSASREA